MHNIAVSRLTLTFRVGLPTVYQNTNALHNGSKLSNICNVVGAQGLEQ